MVSIRMYKHEDTMTEWKFISCAEEIISVRVAYVYYRIFLLDYPGINEIIGVKYLVHITFNYNLHENASRKSISRSYQFFYIYGNLFCSFF